MVTRKSAKTIAFLSGTGGTGRTTAAVGLAAYQAGLGHRTLLLDFCFGWGGLGLDSHNRPTYDALLNSDDPQSAIISAEAGYDLLTCLPPPVLDPSLDDYKRIVWLANGLAGNYEYLLLDSPAGGHPLALLAAGLSERVMLFARPDAASVASSYCLLKSLHAEGIAARAGIVFTLVESAEQAASLKTRFDLLTGQFLGLKLQDQGFIPHLDWHGDGIAFEAEDGRPLEVLRHLNLAEITSLQNETLYGAAGSTFPGAAKVGR